jgi:hypothetical protein
MNTFFRTRTARTFAASVTLALLVAMSGCGTSAVPSTGATSSYGGGAVPGVAPAPGAALGAPATGGTAQHGVAAPNATPTGSSGSTTVEKLIVVNKTVRVETSSVDAAIARIRALTAKDGGDIATLQVSTSADQPIYPQPLSGQTDTADSSVPLTALVVVRVPKATYGDFVASVVALGDVVYQSESAEDVTQQHVDMQARLGNLQAEESRLRALFNRATSVKDTLAVEQDLTRVQGDIESLQAQINYLENQAALATVTIELAAPAPIVSPSGYDWGIRQALTDSIRAFVSTMNGLIVVLGPVLALLIFVGLPLLLIVWLVRGALRRRRAVRDSRTGHAPHSPAAPESDEDPDA